MADNGTYTDTRLTMVTHGHGNSLLTRQTGWNELFGHAYIGRQRLCVISWFFLRDHQTEREDDDNEETLESFTQHLDRRRACMTHHHHHHVLK